MDLTKERERELDKILNDSSKFLEYIKNAKHVKRKISGRVHYSVPCGYKFGGEENLHKFSLESHTHEFTDTFLVPEEFAKSNDLSEQYLENMFGEDPQYIYISEVFVSPEGVSEGTK